MPSADSTSPEVVAVPVNGKNGQYGKNGDRNGGAHAVNGNGARSGKTARNGRGGRRPAARGLKVERYWTRPGRSPYDEVEWQLRTAVITGEGGEVVFEQKEVEIPAFWSQLATNVVAS